MPLVIDCYNLLCATMPAGLAGLDEGGLCRLLAKKGLADGRAVVVCDGGVKPGGAAESPVEGVELVYSGKGRSADEVIVELIEADSAPRRMTVVSSDRQVQKAARRRGAAALSSEEFIHRLAAGRGGGGSGGAGEKPNIGALGTEQVRGWLKEFGIDPESPEGTGGKRPPGKR